MPLAHSPSRAPLRGAATVAALCVLLCLSCSSVGRAACAGRGCFGDAEASQMVDYFVLLQKSLNFSPVIPWVGADFCAWSEITCSGTAVYVDLRNAGIDGTLPEATTGADWAYRISTMQLDDNPGLRGTLPASWNRVLTLYSFSAARTSLTGTVPSEWSSLTAMTAVDLSDTKMTGTLPDSWSAMTKLQRLAIGSGGLTGAVPATWSTLTALRSLSLASSSGLTGTLPSAWAALTSLTHLNMSGTGLAGTLPAAWSALTALTTLDVSACTGVTGSLPAAWLAMTSLTDFAAAGTGISGTLPAEWVSLSAMARFDVHATKVSGTLPAAWMTMSKLVTLKVQDTSLEGTIPTSWGGMASLQAVALSGTAVTCCLPYEWLCGRGLTTAGVGLTSTSSARCAAAAAVCSTSQLQHSTACVATGSGDEGPSYPKWALAVLALLLATAVLVPVILMWACLRSQRVCGFQHAAAADGDDCEAAADMDAALRYEEAAPRAAASPSLMAAAGHNPLSGAWVEDEGRPQLPKCRRVSSGVGARRRPSVESVTTHLTREMSPRVSNAQPQDLPPRVSNAQPQDLPPRRALGRIPSMASSASGHAQYAPLRSAQLPEPEYPATMLGRGELDLNEDDGGLATARSWRSARRLKNNNVSFDM